MKGFSHTQLKNLRGRDSISEDIIQRIGTNICLISGLIISCHPDGQKTPNFNELRSTFLFRFSLAINCLVIWWIVNGGIGSVGYEKLRNDVVDMTYIAYATYFDGILTCDQKLLKIYQDTIFFLGN
jgi:hypothetical protein